MASLSGPGTLITRLGADGLDSAWMITRFHVVGFKSLKEVIVDLGQVNVFIGANGSGKSNLLEALGIVSAAISGQVDDESIRRRGVRLGLPSLYKSSFKGVRVPPHIRFEVTGEFAGEASYQVNLYNPIQAPERNWRYKNELLRDVFGSTGRSPASMRFYDDTRSWVALKLAEIDPQSPSGALAGALAEYAIYSPDTPTLRGVEPDLQDREPVGLAGGSLPQAVRSLIHSPERHNLMDALEMVDWVRYLGTAVTSSLPIPAGVSQRKFALRFIDRYMVEGRNVLSGYDASEGVLYLLFCAVLGLHKDAPPIFAIDNFDQALNPRLARALSNLFANWLISRGNRQALLTTHDPLVLDGLPLLDDRVRLFAVDRDQMGHTVVKRVEVSEQMLALSKSGSPLSEQWITGNFGGVPRGV